VDGRWGVKGAQPNNSLHPTADMSALIISMACGAAGDVGR